MMSENLDRARLHAIVDRARRTLGAQACSILVHEPASGSLVFAAMSGEGAESIGDTESLVGVKIPDSAGVAGWVLASREPLFLDDVANDHRFADDIAETIGYVPRRLMALPLLLEDRALGVLEVLDCPEQARFSETGQLDDLAEEAVLALAGFKPEGSAMSQENVRTVERAIGAINSRDIDAYLAYCTEDVELLQPMVGADYLGSDGIRRFFADIEDIGPDFRIEVQRLQALGDDRVIALLRVEATGRASGIATGAETANVYDFIGGKMSRIRIFLDRDEALEAVGLDPGTPQANEGPA